MTEWGAGDHLDLPGGSLAPRTPSAFENVVAGGLDLTAVIAGGGSGSSISGSESRLSSRRVSGARSGFAGAAPSETSKVIVVLLRLGRDARNRPEAGPFRVRMRRKPAGDLMHDSLDPKRLTCLPPARLLTLATLLGRGAGGWLRGKLARPDRGGREQRCPPDHDRGDRPRVDRDRSDRHRAERRGVVRRGFVLPGSDPCYAPYLFRVAYGIQPLLEKGTDGRGETVTVLSPAPSLSAPAGPSPGSNQLPAATDIRQDLEAFDSMFRLPAARIQVVTTLAGAASPWQASGEEVEDFEIVHAVAPAATLRVVLLPSNVLDSAANATADMLAGLRLAVSGTDVASISWSLGEHYFTTAQVAQMHSILLGAAAHHVTVDRQLRRQRRVSDPRLGSRSRRSAFRPPTRWCWPLAALHSPRIPRPAPTSARPPGRAKHRGAASAICTPVRPIRMAFPGSQR